MPFQPFDRGYDVQTARREEPIGANGFLTFRGVEKKLWVYEVQSGFSMSGSTGQSYRTRSFFAHNMVQPAFTIACQCPNQDIYGDTVEFLRWTQTSFDSSLRLEVVPRFVKDLPAHKGQANRRLRGPHRAIIAEGYVKSVPREHERHVYAPELSFAFIVERMLAGLGSENPVQIRQLKNWNDIIHDQSKQGFIDDPDTPAPVIPPRPADFPPLQGGAQRPGQ
jgi:hypothetical protein